MGSVATESVWEREAKSLDRLPLFLGAGLVAIGAFFALAESDEEEPPADEAVAPEADPEEPAAADDSDEQKTPEAVAEADDEEIPEEIGPVLAAAAHTPTAEAEPAPPPQVPRKRAGRRRFKATAPAIEVPPAPKADPKEKIDAAVDAGWMRASGSLLLVFPKNTPMPWDKARAVCQRGREAGLTRWRLARIGELKRLRSARALPAGTWWSSTAADDDTRALALAPATQSEFPKQDAKALPLCVHVRPSS